MLCKNKLHQCLLAKLCVHPPHLLTLFRKGQNSRFCLSALGDVTEGHKYRSKVSDDTPGQMFSSERLPCISFQLANYVNYITVFLFLSVINNTIVGGLIRNTDAFPSPRHTATGCWLLPHLGRDGSPESELTFCLFFS